MRKPGPRPFFAGFVGIAALLAAVVAMQYRHFRSLPFKIELFNQRMRLPDPQITRLAVLGFDNLWADLMFLRAIQGFGAGWVKPGESREPIYDYFSKVAQVDPRFDPIYRFGQLVVADHGGAGELGDKLLREGVEMNPWDWGIAHLGMFNAIWTMNEPERGRWFIAMARKMPGVPDFVLRTDEYIERKLGRFESAYDATVDHYLRYQAAGNQVELRILQNRFLSILDGWYRREMHEALARFHEERGYRAVSMEELIAAGYLPGFRAPTIPAFQEAAERAILSGMPHDKGADYIREQSRIEIKGVPPEPNGTWYFLSTEMLGVLESTDVPTTASLEKRYDYLVSVHEWIPLLNEHALNIQRFVLGFKNSNNDQWPTFEDVRPALVPDALGGHFRYDENTHIASSTTQIRLDERKDPRLGIWGPGPFPLPLEPTLRDFPEDRKWALENGWMDEEGNLLEK